MVRKLTDELKEMQQEFTEELTSDVLCQYKSNICQIAQGMYIVKQQYTLLYIHR